MAKVYIDLINKGLRTLEQVPAKYKKRSSKVIK